MNAAIGQSAIVLGLVASVVGIITLALGLVRGRTNLLRAGRSYTWLILAGALLAAFAMERGLLTNDFSLKYVAANGGRETPLLFKITGMWSALEGSIMLWTLILAGYIAAMVYKYRDRWSDPLVGWATLVSYVVVAFFFILMVGPANPFHTLGRPFPTDGPGPNPLLQNHPLVAFHPPMLYLGFVGFTIPFAFAIASLITGRMGEGWLVETRRWTLFAWGFLSVGIILGAWWSYEVLGWGGFWAWDPVENASFLPWITGDRVPPLGDGAGAPRHAAAVEPLAAPRHVQPDDPRHIPDPFGSARFGARLHHLGDRPGHPRASSRWSWLVTVGLIAWRGDKLRSPGTIDSPMLARRSLPRQQPAVRRLRLRGPARHRLPVAGRSHQRPAHLGRRARTSIG